MVFQFSLRFEKSLKLREKVNTLCFNHHDPVLPEFLTTCKAMAKSNRPAKALFQNL
jgi:hypothetical protein